MASFFRKLSDIFAGKYKKQPAAPDKTKPFWDVREAQSLEAAGFSAQESEAFVKKMRQAEKKRNPGCRYEGSDAYRPGLCRFRNRG